MTPRRPVILGAHLPGAQLPDARPTPGARLPGTRQLPEARPGAGRTDSASAGRFDLTDHEHRARTAERGTFDLVFLAEGPRPDTLTVLAALAAVTAHVGLAGTVDTTYSEPYELARRLATLDILSGGRVAWNPVTSSGPATAENVRRGGRLSSTERHDRAGELLDAVRLLWDSWGPDAVVAEPGTGRFLRDGQVGDFAFRGRRFDIAGRFTTPRCPQGHPVVVQAAESSAGRDLAAARADAVFSRCRAIEEAREFYADVKARAARHGRHPDEVKVLASASVVLGDTEADARNREPTVAVHRAGPSTAFVGTPSQVAAQLDRYVQRDAADGFVLRVGRAGLDEFVDRVVPLLRDRGVLSDRYAGTTLREHLGLPAPGGRRPSGS